MNPLILLFIILYHAQHISAQNLPIKSYNCTNTIGNYTQDSAFHAILNQVVSDPRKYYQVSNGNGRVNARAFCGRDNYVGGFCDRCVTDAAKYLIKVCPVQKEGIVWYDYGECMFRYSNHSIIRKMSLTPFYKNISSKVVATDKAYWFSRNLTALADRLLVKASNSYDYFKYAADDDIYNPNGVSIYGYMECTPDISSIDCKSCLNHTKNELLSCCDNVVGARYHTPSCSFRFETYPFRYQTAENLVSYNCTNTIGNYTQDSIFHALLNDIISDPLGFNNLTLGNGIDRVSAVAFYGGSGNPYFDDDKSRDKCIRDAIKVLTKVCPVQKEAIVWFEDCMFRYSNNSIHGKMSLTPFYKNISTNVVATGKAYWFSRNLTSLADRLLVETPNSYDGYKYTAHDAIHDPNGESIYGYMVCTPDISAIDCTTCLNHTKNELLSCCGHVVGARYIIPLAALFALRYIPSDIMLSTPQLKRRAHRRMS